LPQRREPNYCLVIAVVVETRIVSGIAIETGTVSLFGHSYIAIETGTVSLFGHSYIAIETGTVLGILFALSTSINDLIQRNMSL